MIIRLVLALLIHLLVIVNGHITMTSPCPRYSKVGKNCPALPSGESIDYDLRSPIGTADNINLPFCHHKKPWASPAAKWTAGQSVTVTFEPDGKAHKGGNCQFSISYDGGKTYVVLYERLKHCFFKGPSDTSVPEVTSYTFKLPKDLPASDKAIFAWTWSNASGNREFYMNCADVSISGTSKSFTARNITVVNYGPSSPKVAEFSDNYDAPLKHYTQNQKYLTVTGDGKVSAGKKPADDTSQDDNAESSGESDGAGDTDPKPDKDDNTPDTDPKPDKEVNTPDTASTGKTMEDGAATDTASMNEGGSGTADDPKEEPIPSGDVPAGSVDGEVASTDDMTMTNDASVDSMSTEMPSVSITATTGAIITDMSSSVTAMASATATGMLGAISTTMPTIVITETPSTMYTTIVDDSDKKENPKHHGKMCCQHCCNFNGGYNGGWFPEMQNLGGYQQYGYYGPGYMVPNPGMDMGNNYYYANGNGGGQGMYPGGIQGGQNGYQPYDQVGNMQPIETSSYQPTVAAGNQQGNQQIYGGYQGFV